MKKIHKQKTHPSIWNFISSLPGDCTELNIFYCVVSLDTSFLDSVKHEHSQKGWQRTRFCGVSGACNSFLVLPNSHHQLLPSPTLRCGNATLGGDYVLSQGWGAGFGFQFNSRGWYKLQKEGGGQESKVIALNWHCRQKEHSLKLDCWAPTTPSVTNLWLRPKRHCFWKCICYSLKYPT